MRRLETENLLLRPFERSDAADLFEYASTQQVGPLAGWAPHTNIAHSRAVIRAFMRQGNILAVCLKDTGRVIGSVGLHPDEKRGGINTKMLGYAINPRFWGRGFAREAAAAVIDCAFQDTDIALLSAYCYPNNLRSKRVLEKCGFVYEGCLRMSFRLYNGTVHDSLCFSMTRDEYEERRAGKGTREAGEKGTQEEGSAYEKKAADEEAAEEKSEGEGKIAGEEKAARKGKAAGEENVMDHGKPSAKLKPMEEETPAKGAAFAGDGMAADEETAEEKFEGEGKVAGKENTAGEGNAAGEENVTDRGKPSAKLKPMEEKAPRMWRLLRVMKRPRENVPPANQEESADKDGPVKE